MTRGVSRRTSNEDSEPTPRDSARDSNAANGADSNSMRKRPGICPQMGSVGRRESNPNVCATGKQQARTRTLKDMVLGETAPQASGGGGFFRFRRRSSVSGGAVAEGKRRRSSLGVGAVAEGKAGGTAGAGSAVSEARLIELLDHRNEMLRVQMQAMNDRLREDVMRALSETQGKVQEGQIRLKNDLNSIRSLVSSVQLRIEDRWMS